MPTLEPISEFRALFTKPFLFVASVSLCKILYFATSSRLLLVLTEQLLLTLERILFNSKQKPELEALVAKVTGYAAISVDACIPLGI